MKLSSVGPPCIIGNERPIILLPRPSERTKMPKIRAQTRTALQICHRGGMSLGPQTKSEKLRLARR